MALGHEPSQGEELQYLTDSDRYSDPSQAFLLRRKPVPQSHVTETEVSSPPKSPRFDDDKAFSRHPGEERAPWNVGHGHTSTPSRVGLLTLFGQGWLIEILSCVLSCAALAAIVITLRIHEGRPLPQWPRLISINSLIAIFTAVLKAAMMMPVAQGLCQLKWHHFATRPRAAIDLNRFDSASRGPWGSLLLMLKAPKQVLACLGAFISVAALAVDPFSQQVIRYEGCLEPVTNMTARIPRTNNYTKTGSAKSDGPYYINDSANFDRQMAAAVYRGLYNPPANVSSILSFDCPTGNCYFGSADGATHSSLAMCYAYRNISDTIVRANSSTQGWRLETGASINQSTILSVARNRLGTGMRGLVQFDTLMYTYDNCASSDLATCDHIRPYAFRANLYPCVQSYVANITSFVLHEREVLSLRVPVTADTGEFMVATNRTLVNGVWQDCRPTDARTVENSVQYPFRTVSNIQVSNETRIQYYPPRCVWAFPRYASLSFSSNLEALFDGQILNSADQQRLYMATGPDHLQILMRNGTADESWVMRYLAGLTDSVTTNMRQNGDTLPPGFTTGTVQVNETCVVVNWAWLSLPSALLLFTIVFLALVSLQSVASPLQQIWKSSDLVLLYHGFDDATSRRLGAVENIVEMENVARRTQAALVTSHDMRTRLVSVE